MAYEEKKYEYDNHFDYALRERDGKKIHISEVPSEEKGKKGYRCIGTNCGNQLIAVPDRKNPEHKPYFKHAPINFSKGEKGCVFSNREYREALASSILTRIKKIKVPPIYKVNPENPNEYKLIENSKYVNAHRVQSEVTFYEDEKGELHWGKNPDVKKRYIIRRPDVVFFDKEDKPILFIELVVTHKLDDDKIADLYRIGIDTIQIKIPQTSEEDIEKSFYTIKNTKWVYNDKEATTKYIQIPRTNNQGVLDAEELESRLFKESYRCRVFRIKELIRGIGKCLESEPYGFAKSYFDDQISRVERNKEATQQRLGELEKQHRKEALGRNSAFEEQLRAEEKELISNIETAEQGLGDLEESNRRTALDRNRGEEEKIESKYTELEGRYLKKDRELEQGMRDYIRAQDIGTPIKNDIEREERNVWELQRDTKQLENEIRERFRRKIELEESEINRIDGELKNIDEKVRTKIDSEIKSTERSIRNIREHQSRIENEIWGEFKNEIEFEDSEIERLTNEENEFEKTVRDEFHRELKESPGKLSRAIKTILDAKRVGNQYADAIRKESSYKRAREFFNKGTW